MSDDFRGADVMCVLTSSSWQSSYS